MNAAHIRIFIASLLSFEFPGNNATRVNRSSIKKGKQIAFTAYSDIIWKFILPWDGAPPSRRFLHA
jgi:hypothetical protein